MMKKLIFALLITFAGASVQAQKYLPDSVDLRASYCIALFQDTNPPIEAFVLENPSAKARLSPVIEANKNNLTRLQNYLVPRLSFLETAALMSARNQFSSDKKTVDACHARACGANFQLKGPTECHAFCNKETGGIGDKQDACSNLTWIPF
jgi:hypothetical protein